MTLENNNDDHGRLEDALPAKVMPARPDVTAGLPLRYGVQFSVQEEYVLLVERAKTLLSERHDKSSLEDIHLRAMRLFVAELEERRVAKKPRPRISAATTRLVYERDEARCTYVDERGQRCRERERLELHHVEAFARGGTDAPENLTLRCRAHNALAAEQDFGRDSVERAKESERHESFAQQSSQPGMPADAAQR